LAFHAEQAALTAPLVTPRDRRAALFRERPSERLQRWVFGTAWAIMPKRIAGLPGVAKLYLAELMAGNYAMPDPNAALDQPPGLAGFVHDLSLPTLIAAYRRGLYPLAHIAPLKWWSPPKRSVLFFTDAHISNNLRRLMRQNRYTVTFDRDFEGVIAACAGHRRRPWHLTWITPRIMRAYAEAFDAGHVHSFEVWNQAGELVAGGYGFGTGAGFSSESQFAREPNASKIGMTVLNWHLAKWGYRFNDGKLIGPLWHSLGFREIPRQEFLAHLAEALRIPAKGGRWDVETDIATVSYWQPNKG